jgi:hypothetical protein
MASYLMIQSLILLQTTSMASYSHENIANRCCSLSAGPEAMQTWMKEQDIANLSKYNEFPAYPTSFIIAADTEIEVSLNIS